MNIIFVLIYLITFSFSLMNLSKKKFLEVLPFSFIISSLILFTSQFIFKTFLVGFIICILFCLYFIFVDILKNKMSLLDIKNKYIDGGFYLFLILYLIIIIYDFNRIFTHWDEFSHWGKMVKEMFRLDKFYSISNSNLLVHKDYPPIISLIQLLFTYLSGSFKEVYLIRSLHLFEGSIIISFINYIDKDMKNNIYKCLFNIIFVFLITLLFDTALVINSIYTDYILALMVSYIFVYIFNIKKLKISNIILLSILCIFLLLIKQVSICFYLLILLLFYLNIIINKKNKKHIFISIILLVFIPLFIFFLWRLYIKSLGIFGQFDLSLIKINNFVNILNSNSWQKQVIFNYGIAIMDKSIINSNILSLSFFQLVLLISFIIIYVIINCKDKVFKNKLITLLITFIVGSIGYSLLMLILYVFTFSKYESLTLASFDRYMSTYILIYIYTLIFIYMSYNKEFFKNKNLSMISLFIIILLIVPSSYLKIRPDQILIQNKKYDKYKNIAYNIDNKVNCYDKVFIIDQIENDGAVFNINYYSNKFSVNTTKYSFDVNVENSYNYFYDNIYNDIKKYDYLYTYSIDDCFVEKYGFLFDDIKVNTLYKINVNNGVKFIEIK